MIKEKKLPAKILTRIPGLIETLRSCDDVTALFFFGGLARGGIKALERSGPGGSTEGEFRRREILG
jgi:hypothetical protein